MAELWKKGIRNIKDQAYEEEERRVRNATSNVKWGASSSDMSKIAADTFDHKKYVRLRAMLWKRLTDIHQTQHVLKALYLVEYLLRNGHERFVEDCRERRRREEIAKLKRYRFIKKTSTGGTEDLGVDVRKKAAAVLRLLDDRQQLNNERVRAQRLRGKITGNSHVSHLSSASPFQPSGTYSKDPAVSGRPVSSSDAEAALAASRRERQRERDRSSAKKAAAPAKAADSDDDEGEASDADEEESESEFVTDSEDDDDIFPTGHMAHDDGGRKKNASTSTHNNKHRSSSGADKHSQKSSRGKSKSGGGDKKKHRRHGSQHDSHKKHSHRSKRGGKEKPKSPQAVGSPDFGAADFDFMSTPKAADGPDPFFMDGAPAPVSQKGKKINASRNTRTPKMSPATVVGGGFESTGIGGGFGVRGGSRRPGVGAGGKPFGGVSVIPSTGGGFGIGRQATAPSFDTPKPKPAIAEEDAFPDESPDFDAFESRGPLSGGGGLNSSALSGRGGGGGGDAFFDDHSAVDAFFESASPTSTGGALGTPGAAPAVGLGGGGGDFDDGDFAPGSTAPVGTGGRASAPRTPANGPLDNPISDLSATPVLGGSDAANLVGASGGSSGGANNIALIAGPTSHRTRTKRRMKSPTAGGLAPGVASSLDAARAPPQSITGSQFDPVKQEQALAAVMKGPGKRDADLLTGEDEPDVGDDWVNQFRDTHREDLQFQAMNPGFDPNRPLHDDDTSSDEEFESESDDNLMHHSRHEPKPRKNSIDDLIGTVDFVNIDDITRTRVHPEAKKTRRTRGVGMEKQRRNKTISEIEAESRSQVTPTTTKAVGKSLSALTLEEKVRRTKKKVKYDSYGFEIPEETPTAQTSNGAADITLAWDPSTPQAPLRPPSQNQNYFSNAAAGVPPPGMYMGTGQHAGPGGSYAQHRGAPGAGGPAAPGAAASAFPNPLNSMDGGFWN